MMPPLGASKTEVKSLRERIANLEQHNEVLFNCWQEAKLISSRHQQRYLAALSDAARKDKIIEELQAHLNPTESD